MKENEDSKDKTIISKETKTELRSDCKQMEPLYQMPFNLKNGTQKTIFIYSNSIPAELAFEFCKENNLDFSTLNNLAIEIESAIKKNSTKIETDPSVHLNQYHLNTQTKTEEKNSNMTGRYRTISDKQMIDTITPNRTQSNLGTNYNNPSMHSSSLSISKKLSQIQLENIRDSQLVYNSKLFMYEFNHNHELEKTKKIITSSANSQNKEINNTLHTNNTISAVKSNHNIENSSRVSSLSVFKHRPQLIYDRLFREASYSKVIAKRKCHFSKSITAYSHARDNSQFTLNENNSIASNSIINMISFKNTIDKECTFKPSISIHKGPGYPKTKKSLKKNKRNNVITTNEILDYNSSFKNTQKPKIVSEHYNTQQYYNTINFTSCENRHVKNTNSQSLNSYFSIRERFNIGQYNAKLKEDEYLESIRKEAFDNLFNELIKDHSNKLMTKHTLNTDRISKVILKDIDSILAMVINDNREISIEDFISLMMELFKSLSLEGKRNIIHYYNYNIGHVKAQSTIRIRNEFPEQKNERRRQQCFFNSKTIAKPILNNRLYHGIKRDGNKSNETVNEKQRNFYYLF